MSSREGGCFGCCSGCVGEVPHHAAFSKHPLISKASSATANTLPDIQHKDTGVCLSQAEQQMMLMDGNSSDQDRGSVARKGEEPREGGCWAVTHRAQALESIPLL